MRRGYKARPHDLDKVMDLKPELIEIHASSDDLEKKIEGNYPIPLVVHLPEYDHDILLDPANSDESLRLKAVNFYAKALDVSREWGTHFKGTPKVIIHPGGWSSEERKSFERNMLYEVFCRSISDLNTIGTDFLVENMPPFAWFYGGSWHCNIFLDPKECRNMCTGNGFGFCLDIVHAYLYCNHLKDSLSIMDFIRIVKPVIGHIHWSDAKGINGEGLAAGKGDIPLKDVFDYLHKLQVGIVSERWFGHKDNFAGFKEDWVYLDNLMGWNQVSKTE